MNKSAPEQRSDDDGESSFAVPPPPLARWVGAYLARCARGGCERFTVFPNARIELLFNFGSPYLTNAAVGEPLQPLAPASLFAPKVARNDHQCGPLTDWFLVQLTLDGCLALLGETAADLLQQDRPLCELLGDQAHDLHHRLRVARSFGERCARFSMWASRRAAGSRSSRISALCESAREYPIATVRNAAEACGLGERRLRDIFLAETGMAPKQWLSILRAERLWAALHPRARGIPEPWSEYADQSHAQREFKHWTGLTIGQYRSIKSQGDGLVNGGARTLVSDRRPSAAPHTDTPMPGAATE